MVRGCLSVLPVIIGVLAAVWIVLHILLGASILALFENVLRFGFAGVAPFIICVGLVFIAIHIFKAMLTPWR
jgi:hypothetical protein